MARLSVCMVVRNEVRRLPRALHSVASVADEVVVVDTGSSEETRRLLDRWPKVRRVDARWRDDFSQLRNLAMDMARGDWILTLDADEWVEHPQDLAALLEQDRVDGWMLTLRNYLPVGDVLRTEETGAVRLFRRNPAWRYVGRVREQIRDAITEGGGTIGHGRLVIGHDGFAHYCGKVCRSIGEDLRLLALAMTEDPDNPVLWYHRGRLNMVAQPMRARRDFRRALSGDAGRLASHLKASAWERLGWLELQRGNHEQATHSAERALCIDRGRALARLVLAQAYLDDGLWAKALIHLRWLEHHALTRFSHPNHVLTMSGFCRGQLQIRVGNRPPVGPSARALGRGEQGGRGVPDEV